MAKNINPMLPASIGGGGVPMIGGQKPPVKPPPEPVNPKTCFKLTIPLCPGSGWYFDRALTKDGSEEDANFGIQMTQAGVVIPRSLMLRIAGAAPSQCLRMDLISVGFILEVIKKPDWFEAHWAALNKMIAES